jgi:serine/threonine protein kinase
MSSPLSSLIPPPFNSADGKVRERFIQEAEILIKLRHPYITPIYGIGEFDGRPYILMEYFPGLNLQGARQKFGSPNPSKVLPFIEYVGSALEHAHSQNIIHRDIKPTNLLTTRGDARVVDFGIAYVMDPERTTRLTIGVVLQSVTCLLRLS